MKRILSSLFAITSLAALSTAVQASQPESIDQLEPGKGEWQAEYYGTFGSSESAERAHVLELYYGVADRLALGVELETEVEEGKLEFDEIGLSALATLKEAEEGGLGVGVMVSAGFDKRVSLTELEARLILEKTSETWWLQGNAMIRRVRENADRGTLLAYGWSLQRSVADDVWLGVEGSGQAARIAGFTAGQERGHYAGPSLTAEFEPAKDREVEVGLAWFRKLAGDGPRNTVRLFVQAGF